MRRVLFIAMVLFSFNAQAQFDWWNQIHNWDGATPWTQYMKYSHAYLGPNAIPIPTLQHSDRSYFKSSSQMSLIEDDSFLSLHNELHWDRGHTQIHITHQSIEYYRMSEEVRDIRISRDEDGEGVLAGDVLDRYQYPTLEKTPAKFVVHFSHQNGSWTTSSSAVYRCARLCLFLFASEELRSLGNWEPFLTTDAGFQVYQTHWVDYPQNDGFLGNIKLQLHKDKTYLSAQLRTFTGYFLDGDWPRLLGAAVEPESLPLAKRNVGWTRGLNDYPFSFLTVGMTYWLDFTSNRNQSPKGTRVIFALSKASDFHFFCASVSPRFLYVRASSYALRTS
jgi:hypothetical protein